MARRIETTSSRTAQMTCMSRACSSLEKDPCYKSGDYIAPLLLPSLLKPFLQLTAARRLFTQKAAPKGVYEYVIARTKYMDAAFARALSLGFGQILILGAGFDTRALRFAGQLGQTRVFELDAPTTQQAKIGQYRKRGLSSPPGLAYIAIDFDKETLSDKLDQAGFDAEVASLFILEGVLMYLQPESVEATFRAIVQHAGPNSRLVFDYVRSSVLGNDSRPDETGLKETVAAAGEQWHFGLEEGRLDEFLGPLGLRLVEQKTPSDLERDYFRGRQCRGPGRVNPAHCLVTAEKA